MVHSKLIDLVDYLRNGPSRTRVGLWVAPLNWFGKETELAISLAVQPMDVSKFYLGDLPPGATHARISRRKVVAALDKITSSNGQYDCVLIYNLDLLQAALKTVERQQVWADLFNGLPHRSRALLIMMPASANSLMPEGELLDKWKNEKRFFIE